MCVCVSVCVKRERERGRGRDRDIYFKEMAYMIVGAGNCKICRAGEQAGDAGKS